MATERPCHFYRIFNNHSMGWGIGHCDLGIIWTICEGDMRFCENPDALIRNLYAAWGKRKRGKGKYEVQYEAKL